MQLIKISRQLEKISETHQAEIELLTRCLDKWYDKYLFEKQEKEIAQSRLPERKSYTENSLIKVVRIEGKFRYEDNVSQDCEYADCCDAEIIKVVRLSDQPLVELVIIHVKEITGF